MLQVSEMADYNYKIAYCLATYNSEPYIEDCIGSILMQKLDGDFETKIFVTDDASTDSTLKVLKSFKPIANIDIKFRRYNSQGICALPKNNSIARALKWKADYIVLMDADDTLEQNFTTKLTNRLIHSSDTWATCYGKMFGAGHGKIFPQANKKVIDMSYDNGIASWAVIKAKELKAVNGYDFVLHEDYDLWIRLLKRGKTYHVEPEFLYNYRIHQKQKTNTIDQALAFKEIYNAHFK